jgi:hypothetical protein
MNDHGRTVREIRRHSRWTRSVRRILQDDDADVPVREADSVHDPPDPTTLKPKDLDAVEFS